MEDLHIAAQAYYNNAPTEVQQLAQNFFRIMDVNGDGRVSYVEFVEFFTQCGYVVEPSYFGKLDQNGDGSLEFREVLTLYYIMRTRDASCDSCGVNLPQLYFTCVQCFDSVGDTYDLCATCYSARRFHHPHGSFLDSYVLLRSRRRLPPRANPHLVRKFSCCFYLLFCFVFFYPVSMYC